MKNHPTDQLTLLLTSFHEIFQDWMNTGKINQQNPSEFLRMQAEILKVSQEEVVTNPSQAFLQLIELINAQIQAVDETDNDQSPQDEVWQHLTNTLQNYGVSLNQTEDQLLGQLQALIGNADEVLNTDASAPSPKNDEAVLTHPVWQQITQFSDNLKSRFQTTSNPSQQEYQQLNDLLQEVSQKLEKPQGQDLDQLASYLEEKVVDILGLETKEEKEQKVLQEYRDLARQSIAESLAKYGIESKAK